MSTKTTPKPPEPFTDGRSYESYIGRWSRPVAVEFLRWLRPPRDLDWLDVGCGTGALTETILELAEPRSVAGVDPSAAQAAYARERVADPRAAFVVGSAQALPFPGNSSDVAVFGLVLNFVPDIPAALREIVRVVRPQGWVGGYVWDYAQGMEMLRLFWDTAVALDPAAEALDEGRRFPICRPGALRHALGEAGFTAVEVRSIDIPTRFSDFDDLWSPFLRGQGPAPRYLATRSESAREAIRQTMRERLPAAPDGSLVLTARAWAFRGRVPPTP